MISSMRRAGAATTKIAYREFRGRAPSPRALLRKRGLEAEPAAKGTG